MIPGDLMAGIRAAHAQAERVREAEEEAMTPYTPGELATDWEFKIIRSVLKQFGNQDVRDRVLAEEERVGWVLVEVFDDGRIRLKRQRPSRRHEVIEGYDPYRTNIPYHPVPTTPGQKAALLVLVAALVVVVVALFATGVLR